MAKPRRATHASIRKTVRIDPLSIEILENEFESLGNALFYIAQGIDQFRRWKGMLTYEEPPAPPPPKNKYSLEEEVIIAKGLETILRQEKTDLKVWKEYLRVQEKILDELTPESMKRYGNGKVTL